MNILNNSYLNLFYLRCLETLVCIEKCAFKIDMLPKTKVCVN